MATEGVAPKKGRGRARTALLAGGAMLTLLVGVAAAGLRGRPRARAVATGETSKSATHAGEPLPYVNFIPVKKEHRGKSGVTVHDKERAYRGYTLYVPKPEASAKLIDMQGEVVHEWASEVGQPGTDVPVPQTFKGWYPVRMAPNGDVLAVVTRKALLRFDWSSKLLWSVPVHAHHDVILDEAGDIYTLADALRLVELGDKKRLIADNTIVVLSPEGEIKKQISLFDVVMKDETLKASLVGVAKQRFGRLDRIGLAALVRAWDEAIEDDDQHATFARSTLGTPESIERADKMLRDGPGDMDAYRARLLLRAIPADPSDIFHSNAVQPLKAHPAGLWKDGDLLVSIRHLDLVAVVDREKEAFVWTYGPGEILGQHQPSMLPNGNILIFDNGKPWGRPKKAFRKFSRVIEVDAETKKIVWEYTGTPPKSFYSSAESGAQLLPNGNVLVTESSTARGFEVTREKEIVWEYFNPKGDATHRSGIYRLERLSPEVVEPLIRRR